MSTGVGIFFWKTCVQTASPSQAGVECIINTSALATAPSSSNRSTFNLFLTGSTLKTKKWVLIAHTAPSVYTYPRVPSAWQT